jgi:uncharacterized membrane protein YcaP (DUF421 family)
MEAFRHALSVFNSYAGPLLGIGVESKDLTFAQVSLRGVVVLLVSLAIIRTGNKRSLAEKTAFDAVLIVILASVLARAINGSGPFFATLGGSLVMVLLHRFMGWIAARSHAFGIIIKGRPAALVRNGEVVRDEMRRNSISIHDLEEDLRSSASTEHLRKIRLATLERSGEISFIKNQG